MAKLPVGIFFFLITLSKAQNDLSSDAEYVGDSRPEPFTPTVTASCQLNRNRMVITLTTILPFHGILLSSNQRNNSECYVEGNGQTQTRLSLNMLASISDHDYCGVSVNHKTNEKTAQISVRQNKVLELSDDRNYLVSCSKFDSKPPSAATPAHLALYDSDNREALEVVKSYAYKLKIKTSKEHKNFRIRNCFAFSGANQRVPLFDEDGCPESSYISRWTFAENSAEARIPSMFKFQSSRLLTFQCHVLFCSTEDCPNPTCKETQAFKFIRPIPEALLGSNDTDAIASSTVTVLEPGEKLSPLTLSTDPDAETCVGRFCPTWLLWLAIIFGVLFLLMLLVNLFLCTALTCTCTRTELLEKTPSIIIEPDYDPYFDNSQYNSRYAINHGGSNKAYSDMSDHYATPGGNLRVTESSRPNSRFSGK